MSGLAAVASEARMWCSRAVALGRSVQALRTPELCPSDISLRGALVVGKTEKELNDIRAMAVENLCLQRRRLLALRGSTVSPTLERPSGRFLSLNLDSVFFDGASAAASAGFFDKEDLPPWDTWIAYGLAQPGAPFTLLSWVPGDYAQLAEQGMRVHMAEGYSWLTDDQALMFESHRAERSV